MGRRERISIQADKDVLVGQSADLVMYSDDFATEVFSVDGATGYCHMTVAMATGDSSRGLYVEATPTSTTAGLRQGAIGIYMNRPAETVWATWDGNPDCGLKIQVNNRSVSGSNGAVRGLDINARNRSSGTCSWINGAYITAEHSDGTLASNVTALEVHPKNNGVCNGNVYGIKLYDESQSATGTTYLLHMSCTADSPFTREFCMYIDAGASSGWTNGLTFDGAVTNPLDFVDSDGTNGATYSSGHYASLGAVDGKIQVDIGGNTLYIPCYASIAA